MPGKTSSNARSARRQEVEESLDEYLGPALILVFRRSKTSTRTQFINTAIKRLVGGKFDTEESGRVLPHKTEEDLTLKKKRAGFARGRSSRKDGDGVAKCDGEGDVSEDAAWERDDCDLRPLLKEIRGILKDAEQSDDINTIYAANMGELIRDHIEVPKAWLKRFRKNRARMEKERREAVGLGGLELGVCVGGGGRVSGQPFLALCAEDVSVSR